VEKNKNDDVQKAMAKAKQLIEKKKYDDARAILITIDHPKAEEWLNRINQISPTTSQTIVVKEKAKGGCVRNTLVFLGLIFVCMIIGVLANPNARTGSSGSGSRSTPRSSSAGAQTDAPTEIPDAGTRGNPYPAGAIQDIRDGRLRVDGIQKDMTSEVRSMNMFNTEPESGEEWVLVDVTFFCDLSTDEVCTTQFMQFELVGTLGRAYNHQSVAVIDNAFGAEVFGGGQATGTLGFIVDSSDNGLMLILVDGGRKFFAIP
jgi:hypothetical protein